MNLAFMENEKQPKKVIVLSDAVYHSYLGKYFLGQTDLITFGGSYNGWGALINPENSNVNMFLNAYTISNFASVPLTAEGWLSSVLPGKPKLSPYFAAGNQSITPSPMPKVKIKNASMVSPTPTSGTYTFVRRVEPNETLTKHDFQGMYIIPPGSSFALFFLSPGKEQIQTRVAFGWWEEKVNI
ncbi:DUF6143 family protein [Ruminiclostridium cellulolyticum]|uniref:Uncharacterized protein n=1 Tax=Ruminiclostridium cellulolyticum (strain ATCC 35319 / DSM 5812 / JCM 6584 / H10) TaxID=394503 RepID=B8I1E3_RUMCH|nr:DUF6143 family protein [Ruminiclostridium cellulolyticum]ACL75741.1 conserved hypothetical protein [Ruminiclostridium cellulolyticum H10]